MKKQFFLFAVLSLFVFADIFLLYSYFTRRKNYLSIQNQISLLKNTFDSNNNVRHDFNQTVSSFISLCANENWTLKKYSSTNDSYTIDLLLTPDELNTFFTKLLSLNLYCKFSSFDLSLQSENLSLRIVIKSDDFPLCSSPCNVSINKNFFPIKNVKSFVKINSAAKTNELIQVTEQEKKIDHASLEPVVEVCPFKIISVIYDSSDSIKSLYFKDSFDVIQNVERDFSMPDDKFYFTFNNKSFYFSESCL